MRTRKAEYLRGGLSGWAPAPHPHRSEERPEVGRERASAKEIRREITVAEGARLCVAGATPRRLRSGSREGPQRTHQREERHQTDSARNWGGKD
ncbi:hypothetical protein NDU88_001808 [Pleurodeles waltl]|uniref:Uncharacterized protein n=1 Tax=Pleurodeles waltl TaxID=8319 RepID=A0AAV7SBW4_PLEWA|nr:hypothetical protein NDU88_001808 [Pleurodeles waltl]